MGFEQAMNSGCMTENRWFRVYLQRKSAGVSCLGLIASKRVMPAATARNFAKRLVRETFRQEFPLNLPVNVVVRIKRKLTPDLSAEGRRALLQLLQVGQV